MGYSTYCIVTLGGIKSYVKAYTKEEAIAKLKNDPLFCDAEPIIVDCYVVELCTFLKSRA